MEQEPTEGYYDSCGLTLEDQHTMSFEQASEEFWAKLAQEDAMECSVSCYKTVFGYHTVNCPRRGAEDVAAEKQSQAQIDIALGK